MVWCEVVWCEVVWCDDGVRWHGVKCGMVCNVMVVKCYGLKR